MSNLGKDLTDLTKEYVQKTKDDLVGIFSPKNTLIALLIIFFDAFATFIPLLCEENIEKFLPQLIIEVSFLAFALLLAKLHTNFVKKNKRLSKSTDIIAVFLLLGITIPKFEAVIRSTQMMSTPFVLGLTFLTNFFILELSVTKNRSKMVFIGFVAIYAFIATGSAQYLYATPFVQAASFGFTGIWLITVRERVKKNLFNENIFLFEKEKLWQGIVQDFPEWTFLIDANKNVIFSNSQSHQNTKSVLMRLKTAAPQTEHLSIDPRDVDIKTIGADESLTNSSHSNAGEKLSKLHHIKEISITKGEENAYSFFGPIIDRMATQSGATSKEFRDTVNLTKVGSLALDGIESIDNTRVDKYQIKVFKKWLKTSDLLSIIDIIADNIKAFKLVYPKGALELCGKINMTNQEAFSSKTITDKSMDIKISVTEFQQRDSIILVISDITQRDMISRLEGVNEYKINLLASFSHELRTPLNANLNLLETALDHREMTAELKKSYILPALRSAKLLFYMISDILDYSQLSLNKISVKVTTFSLRMLIYQIADLFRMQATQKGLKLNVKLTEEGEIKNDPARLAQILVTLMSNAVKFTYQGSITIETIRQDQNIVISVTDTGIGIDDKAAKKLNQILQGSDKLEKLTDESTGCNLGLTVASKLAFFVSTNKATGLTFHRHASGGTTFYFKVEDRKLHNQKSIIDMSLSVCGTQTLARGYTEKNEELRSQKTGLTNSIVGNMNEGTMLTLPEEGIADFIDNIEYDGGGMFKNGLQSVPRLDTNYDTRKSTNTSHRLTENNVNYKDVLKSSYSKKNSSLPSNGACKCDEILIVDDDSFNILAAQKLMESQGMKSMCAYNGKLAIELIEAKKKCCDTCRIFRMILMDCNMPVMDGYECTKYLKAKMLNEELPRIPIIACTSFVTHFDAQACFNSGMDDYTTKPLSKEKFTSICYKWIKRKSLPE